MDRHADRLKMKKRVVEKQAARADMHMHISISGSKVEEQEINRCSDMKPNHCSPGETVRQTPVRFSTIFRALGAQLWLMGFMSLRCHRPLNHVRLCRRASR
jgi:hypothetical protein